MPMPNPNSRPDSGRAPSPSGVDSTKQRADEIDRIGLIRDLRIIAVETIVTNDNVAVEIHLDSADIASIHFTFPKH